METFKRYLISSVITFVAGFAIVVTPQLDSLTLESFKDGSLVGLIFFGVRAGVKLMAEGFLLWYHRQAGK